MKCFQIIFNINLNLIPFLYFLIYHPMNYVFFLNCDLSFFLNYLFDQFHF